ncbi:AfsR/SARP family transcriptional regulator [Nonomuraea zeae]|uniref:Tetratricopeptide repeat protein n=1 Tax=Nonomuraea zeae TaxID=1642303 RepID=A0A5S4GWF3_9ACTN|nr:tetratricopeptide repeat protein [Nonomuraea zeae]TMR37217.1 tetratricopeptide repeat protein [Nonomuraea zeae]
MEFFLLGVMGASVEARAIDLGTRRQRYVLALLCLEVNRQVGIDRLIEHLWPHDPPSSCRGIIHTYVSGLRSVFRASGAERYQVALERGRSGYLLRCDPARIDLHRFRALTAEARTGGDDERRAALLERALALWRGPALAGVGDEQARARLTGGLEEARRTAVEDLAEARLRLGRHQGVLDELFALAAEFPTRPRMVGALMRALHHAGRTAEALEVYRNTRRRMAEELGLDPPAELRELQVALLRGDERAPPVPASRPAGTAPRQLPADLTTFVGRVAELDRLLGDERAAAVVISAVDGMAGVGKTVLAVHAAHLLAARYPDGQLFLDLHGFTHGMRPVDPADALGRMLRVLGVPDDQIPPDEESRAALYRTRLADRRVLVLLDNAAAEEQVRPLLPGAPGCLVLITSRIRFTGLDDVRPLSLDVLPTADAVALFARVTGTDRPRHLVEEIVELCGRLPLAIRTAAARLRSRPAWTVEYLARRLRGHQQRLDDLSGGARGVSVAIDLSYRQVDAALRRLYRLLSLHPGADIDAYAAAAMAGLSLSQATRALDALVDANLLQEPVAGRFRFHDLIRAHAADACAREEPGAERHRATARLLDHYTQTASLAMAALYPYDAENRPRLATPDGPAPDVAGRREATEWLAAELGNLLAAPHIDAGGPSPRVVELSAILHRHLRTRAEYSRAATLHEHAARAARTLGDRAGELEALWALGVTRWFQGRYAEAEEHLQQALEIADAIGHRTGAINALHGLGHIHTMRGRHEPAVDCYRRVLDHAHAIGHLAGELEARWGLGHIHRLRGQWGPAEESFERAVVIARKLGHHEGELNSLYGLGHVHRLQGRHEPALDCYQQVMDIARESGDRVGELTALRGFGHIRLRQGAYAAAVECFERALEIAEDTGHRFSELHTLRGLGHAHLKQGRHERAAADFRRALDLALEIGDGNGRLQSLYGLARTCQAAGAPDRALDHYRAACDLPPEPTNDRVHVLHGMAEAHHDLGQHEQARACWRQALDILDGLGTTATEEVTADLIRDRLAASPGHGG